VKFCNYNNTPTKIRCINTKDIKSDKRNRADGNDKIKEGKRNYQMCKRA
jgi:hypothetical protein